MTEQEGFDATMKKVPAPTQCTRATHLVDTLSPMSIPDYQQLMLPVLICASAGEVRIGSVVDELASKLNLTPEQKSEFLPSGRQTVFSNRVHWAKSYLSKAGLVEITRRGFFRITPRGVAVVESKPEKIDNKYLNQFEEFRRFRDRSAPESAQKDDWTAPLEQPETPDEVMRSAHTQIEVALGQDLLDRIRQAPPEFFERLMITLLLSMGFGGSAAEAGRRLGGSGDGGDQDALGLDRVYVQAKRYSATNSVGPGAIRDFFGSLDRHKATKGLFVTTSSFSPAARDTAEFLSKRIVLIDGEQLTQLMIRHNVGCRVEATLHIKRLDEEFFDE
jgi:restriction system protein